MSRGLKRGWIKEKGNVGEYMAVFLCLLFMTMLMTTYFESVRLVEQKEQVSQIARKYILKMETVGSLNQSDRAALLDELTKAGVTDINLRETTLNTVNYGEDIVLHITGKLRGTYELEEKKVSTAKY